MALPCDCRGVTLQIGDRDYDECLRCHVGALVQVFWSWDTKFLVMYLGYYGC